MARTAQMKRQVSVLVTDEMKAFLIGSAMVENASEADVIRALLDESITRAAGGALGEEEIKRRVEVGRVELARLDAEREARLAAERKAS